MRPEFQATTLLLLLLLPVKLFCQDTIIFQNKHTFPAYVVEEHELDVIFKKNTLAKSLTYRLEKRFVTGIIYEDPAAGLLKFKSQPSLPLQNLDLWVTPMDTGQVVSGSLHRLNDTTLILRTLGAKLADVEAGTTPEVVHILSYQDIFRIRARRHSRMRKFAAWGAAGGFVAGALTGLLLYDSDPPCDPTGIDGQMCDNSLLSPRTRWEKSLVLAFGSSGAGLVAGGVVGAVKVTIPIGGKRDNFNAAIPKLQRMAR